MQRIALANLVIPASREESVRAAELAILDAGATGARIVCFPECFVPGYRGLGYEPPPPDAEFLERAWEQLGDAAKRAAIAVILGTERLVDGALLATALVLNADGTRGGFQDKVQIDPSEEGIYTAGRNQDTGEDLPFTKIVKAGPPKENLEAQDPDSDCEPGARATQATDRDIGVPRKELRREATKRQVFQAGPIAFGVAICHEGWRYPETVRWPARQGAHIVFHPHFSVAEPGGYVPSTFGDPANTFHEKAALCRAAENTCYFATVNCASVGSPTTSAVVNPDGTVLCWQPYGKEGLLMSEIDLDEATGLLAKRWKA